MAWTDTTVLAHEILSAENKYDLLDNSELMHGLKTMRLYKLDMLSSIVINRRAFEVNDLAEDQLQFATTPHDNTFVEFVVQEDDEEKSICIMGLMFTPHYVWIFNKIGSDEGVTLLSGRFDRSTRKFVSIHKDVTNFQDNSLGMILVGEMFFHALHNKSKMTVTEKPAFRKISKGKLRAYAAHSLINIDLNEIAEVNKHLSENERAGYRAHEVRGTWVNYDKDENCTHTWNLREGETDRYQCPKCGQRRSWRKAHQQGDASLGYVTHEYRITAS